ncbi:MAG: long-chain-acyl-CoA synthetase [Gammaproteobacteria bacterium]|nr:long-chain-acyl-CoA synthetase [Gammaproteobacteria bacterium]
MSFLPMLLKLKKGMKPRPQETRDCFGTRVEETARKHPNACAILFEGRDISWRDFNAMANRYAHYLSDRGIKRGDAVSVFMENRIEYMAMLVAMNKLGVIGGLLNTNLTGRSLAHCIKVAKSVACIVGEERITEFAEVKEETDITDERLFFMPDNSQGACPEWATDIATESEECSEDNHAECVNSSLGETAFYIYTSGTTGLPKAAVMSNNRYLTAATLSGVAGLSCTVSDRIYLCLPLYHATGLLLGAGSSFTTGASMFIRRKFSASSFLNDIRENRCTHMIYIGELCRYLMNLDETDRDAENPLHTMMGNGLRPDVWLEFKKRYGINRICEIYGASEGNVSFANMLNKDCTVGLTSAEVTIVDYDVENDEIVKDANGFCIETPKGQPGLLLGKITPDYKFEGYTDPDATEGKILRNALEDGDAWFNTGDLMKTIDVGFNLGYDHFQFVDRIGDTFRWKSENVSTNEVGEIINGFDQIQFCNVYGVEVPKADGKAGMVALTLDETVKELDLESFSDFVNSNLPKYAVPVFVRIQPNIEVTGTFKMVKGDLRKEAYNIDEIADSVYVMKPGESVYTELTSGYVGLIKSGAAGY